MPNEKIQEFRPTPVRSRTSAGLLMFRRRGDKVEFLLAHPGGPLFVRKDEGHWTIPKGEAAPGEDLLTRARMEFAEEVGLEPKGPYLPLGTILQKGGKIVHAWAVEGDLPEGFAHHSNTFELEWPPRSGQVQMFPEIDRAEFFAEKLAREKVKPTQTPFFDRLLATLQA
ncbi:MAG: NUDIX domain-containing protein [Chthoniobacterales bacterium]